MLCNTLLLNCFRWLLSWEILLEFRISRRNWRNWRLCKRLSESRNTLWILRLMREESIWLCLIRIWSCIISIINISIQGKSSWWNLRFILTHIVSTLAIPKRRILWWCKISIRYIWSTILIVIMNIAYSC